MRSALKIILILLLIPAALFLWILQLFLFAGIFSMCHAGRKNQEKPASGQTDDGSPYIKTASNPLK
jgi:hypothetical protein